MCVSAQTDAGEAVYCPYSKYFLIKERLFGYTHVWSQHKQRCTHMYRVHCNLVHLGAHMHTLSQQKQELGDTANQPQVLFFNLTVDQAEELLSGQLRLHYS